MIGDYLMYNNMPYRVIQIEDVLHEGWMLENGVEDCGKPIPLTEEVLEKNGWEHWCDIIGNTIGYFEGDNHNYLEITIGDDGIWWSINDNEYYILKLKYVHELQHALKMNGIKKEIVI